MKFLSKSESPVENNKIFLGERIKTYCNTLRQLSYRHRALLTDIRITTGNYLNLAQAESANAVFVPYQNGALFGEVNSHSFFDIMLEIPENFHDGCFAFLATGGCSTLFSGPLMNEGRILYNEGQQIGSNIPPHLLLSVDGKIVQGMDANHQEALLAEYKPGERLRLGINAYIPREGSASYLKFEIAELDNEISTLFFDLYTPLEAVDVVGDTTEAGIDILQHLDRSVSCIDLREPYSEAFYTGIRNAQRYMDYFYREVCKPGSKLVSVIGHTHIDVAWKWDLGQTREKAVRSFATALRLMERYPDFQFMLSQPQLYEYVKEDAPELFQKVKERVAEGRWEVEGAMWLEPDTNIPSGEALVRQIIHGRRFFREEFNKESEVLWLPDVFGYSAALPQILSKSGIKYFATSKLGWNQYNIFPYTTFHWVGLDGSDVLVQLITTQEDGNKTARTTYNGMLGAPHVIGNYNRHSQKELTKNTLMPFGYGDGGGGPTPQMMEKYHRLKQGIPSVPTIKMEPVKEYFHRLEKCLAEQEHVPSWKGELYFECHRGTYTSIAEIKRNNRKAEFLLKQLEQLYTLLYLNGAPYPQRELQTLWQLLLLNQFHDTLPGSAIAAVYEDSAKQFSQLFEQGGKLLEQALHILTAPKKDYVTIYNTTGFVRSELLELAGNYSLADEQGTLRSQTTHKDGDAVTLVQLLELPANGSKSYCKAPQNPEQSRMTITEGLMENDYFRIALNEYGEFSSIWDKRAGRELLSGLGNVITAYQDLPSRHDNWNIDVFYNKKSFPMRENVVVQVVERGPLRATLRVEKNFSHSRLVQDISIYDELARIDFDTRLFWDDEHFMVKTCFPVAVHSDELVCDIQFGNIKRSLLKNTSWDLARFEVPAHKWIDISERNYGAALLNDCKYGFTLDGQKLEMTLLRSGTFPSICADRGEHRIRYALCPHQGDFATAGCDRQAIFFNESLLVSEGQRAENSFAHVDTPNVIMETIKKCEDGDGVILRLYENHNRRTETTIRFDRPFCKIARCDIMEHNSITLGENTDSVTLTVAPYEIVTLKLL